LTYVEETVRNDAPACNRLYEFVNLFGDQLRRVKTEDGSSLAATNHVFNLNAIIGGKLGKDERPQLFYVFPEGNWVESNPDSPYFMIGRTYYGKPILDLLLRSDTSLQSSLALALLAFDATHASVTDVGYPIDVAVLANHDSKPRFQRFNEAELITTIDCWRASLSQSLQNLPMDWASQLLPSTIAQGHTL